MDPHETLLPLTSSPSFVIFNFSFSHGISDFKEGLFGILYPTLKWVDFLINDTRTSVIASLVFKTSSKHALSQTSCALAVTSLNSLPLSQGGKRVTIGSYNWGLTTYFHSVQSGPSCSGVWQQAVAKDWPLIHSMSLGVCVCLGGGLT